METFKKNERLTGKKRIEHLLLHGKNFSHPSFKIKWIFTDEKLKASAQLGISVPKRNFPLAVDRNRIKRLIREAYRKNKKIIFDPLVNDNKKCIFLLIYVSKEMPLYLEIESKIVLILHQLGGNIVKTRLSDEQSS